MGSSLRRAIVLLMTVGLLMAACGGDDDAADSPAGVVTTASSGDQSATPSEEQPGAQTSGDVSIPVAPGADGVATTEAGPLTVVQFIVPLDQQQATISFYDDWTDSQADEYVRTEAESGGVSWQNAPDTGGQRHIISVLSPIEGDDFVTVTLTVGPAE